MSASTISRKTIIAAIAFAIAGIAGATYFGLDVLRSAAATDTRKGIASVKSSGNKVVATVDGSDITEAELAPFLNAGLDKAVAIDRAINKVVAANNADRLYKQASQSAMQSAKNEILANVFVNQRSAEVRNSVTDADVKAFYADRVKVEDFTTFRLKFFVSVDPKESQDVFDALGRGDKDALAKLAFAKKEGDHYVNAAEVPYGLGVAIKKLKAGERLQPVMVREGALVLYVDDVKVNPKPELAKVQAEIKDLIVNERFNEDMKTRRTASKIELRG